MDWRILFAALYVWAVLASLWAGFSAKRFVAEHPAISDERALNAFKALARVNMYLALIQIGVLGAGCIVGIILIIRYKLTGLIVVVAANAVTLGLGKYFRAYENAARSLPAADEALAREHRRVSESWLKKPLPDF